MRTTLKGIMNKLFSQMSKIYSDKLSSYEFNEIINDIKSKCEEVSKESSLGFNLSYTILNLLFSLFLL